MRMTTKQLENYEKTMALLDAVWTYNLLDLKKLHNKPRGIRSTQTGALVMLLIKLEIIK